MPKVAKDEQIEGKLSKRLPQAEVETTELMVELPISEPFASNFPIHVNLQLSSETGNTLRRIARAYDRSGATLKNGRRVVDPGTAMRKILEVIAEATT